MNAGDRVPLGRTGLAVSRLGLSATYWPGRKAIHAALDAGINYLFCYGFDLQMIRAVRDLSPAERDGVVVATGAYNYIWFRQNIRRTLERRLRQMRTDRIDVFHFLGVMKAHQFTGEVRDTLLELRESGTVRSIAVSTHDRRFAGRLAAEGVVDSLMIRYNAAHRGAESDIFPHLGAHGTGIASCTATRWRYLLRRPPAWPKDQPIPTAGHCYRFVLSNPAVNVCLTAPSNEAQLRSNIREIEKGPLSEGEMDMMRRFGDAVHAAGNWFMGG